MRERLLVQAAYLEGDNAPTALLTIDCPTEVEANLMADLALSVQNGEAVMEKVPDVLIGDVNFHFEMLPIKGSPEQMLARLYAKRNKRDLTHSVYLQAVVDRPSAETFRYYHTLRRSYLLTVSVNGVPMPEKLYLVKYIARYPWRPRLEQPEPVSNQILGI